MSIGVGQVFRRDGCDDNRELEILAFRNDVYYIIYLDNEYIEKCEKEKFEKYVSLGDLVLVKEDIELNSLSRLSEVD